MRQSVKIVLLGLTVLIQSAFAEKIEFTCDDAKALTVKASDTGFTRISFKGDKLRDVMGLEEDVIVEKNEAEGILFLKNVKNKQTITLITESGLIQDLTLVPGGKGTMNIVLKPGMNEPVSEPGNQTITQEMSIETKMPLFAQSLNTQEMLIHMIKHLYGGTGDVLTEGNENIRFSSNGLEAVSTRTIHNQGIIGEVFTIKNTHNNTTILLEKDFYQKGDLALALSKKQLQAGETTSLFVIRSM